MAKAKRAKTRGRLDPIRLTRDELLAAVASGRVSPAALRRELERRAAKKASKAPKKRPAKAPPRRKKPAPPPKAAKPRPKRATRPKPPPRARKPPSAAERREALRRAEARRAAARSAAALKAAATRRRRALEKLRKQAEQRAKARARVERLVAMGLSRSAARGHPKPGELTAAALRAWHRAAERGTPAERELAARRIVDFVPPERLVDATTTEGLEQLAELFEEFGFARRESYTLAIYSARVAAPGVAA